MKVICAKAQVSIPNKAYYYSRQINMGFSRWTYAVRQFRHILQKYILSYRITPKNQKGISVLKN